MRATGPKWRAGLDNGHAWYLNVRVEDQGFGPMHEAEYSLAVAKAVGATTGDKHLTVPINAEERQQARQLVYGDEPAASIKRPIIAMHPGSGGYIIARRRAPHRFGQLYHALYHDAGWH